MATTLHRVMQNFVWRLEAITPTSDISSKPFLSLDRTKTNEGDSAGLERSFLLSWLGRGPEEEATDQYQLSAEHEWQLDVFYWAGRGYETTHEIILQDQFDIVKTLRNDALYVGYADDHSTDDLSIIDRHTVKIEVNNESDDLWILRFVFSTHVKEVS